MNLPPLEPESSHLGDWLAPTDLEPVIERQCELYAKRYATQFIGDADDLKQSVRLALFEKWGVGGPDEPERVRELEAFQVIGTAIRDEIESTKRAGAFAIGSQDVEWDGLEVVDRNLDPNQRYTLDCILMAVAKIVKKPNYEMAYLMLACGWEPEEVTRYFRSKRDDRHYYSPSEVRKRVAIAAREVRLYLNRDYLTELNTISFRWW